MDCKLNSVGYICVLGEGFNMYKMYQTMSVNLVHNLLYQGWQVPDVRCIQRASRIGLRHRFMQSHSHANPDPLVKIGDTNFKLRKSNFKNN